MADSGGNSGSTVPRIRQHLHVSIRPRGSQACISVAKEAGSLSCEDSEEAGLISWEYFQIYQLNERPKSQAGQPEKVNIDSGLPPGPGSSLQVLQRNQYLILAYSQRTNAMLGG